MPRLVSATVLRLQAIVCALLLGATVTACAPDGLTREGTPPSQANVQASSIGDPDLAALVEADLTCLYSKAGLLPNESSSLGKFRSVVSAVLAGDLAGAQDDADKLIKFIELKYSQYSNKTGTVDCGPPIGQIGLTELKERTVARINAYVTLGGNVCEIPEGSPETFCRTADDQTAFVYFPAGIFEQLTYVSVEENPPGFTRLQELGFDEYPTYVRVVTEPLSNFEDDLLFPIKPLVVVCFNEQVVPQDEALRERLLLGHRHTEENGDVTFKLLPTPNYGAYEADVLTEATNFCGTGETASVPTPFSPSTLLGRVANRVASFLAPAPLQASAALAFRGVGGSAEEFSEFGAIDRGFTGRGGVGGSAEEFNRAGAVEGLASATVSDDGTTVTGKVGVDSEVTDPSELPRVRVVSPWSLTPIAGVKVFFQLSDPVQAQYSPASSAGFCGATEAVTDANGEASPPCLNFGNTVGFKNLKVTFDPTDVDAEACMIDNATGVCDAAAALNFLIATVAGDPAKLAVINTPGATAPAGVAMVDQPILQVQDAGGNPVTNLAADVTVSVSVKKADGSAGGSLSGGLGTTDKALSKVSFTGLALGGTVGTAYRIAFASAGLDTAFANVTVSAPGAAANLAVTPATATAQAGGLIPTITATVTDSFGNGVAGATVSVATADLGCFSSATDCTTATTGSAGTATFGDLAVRGPGLSRTLTFSASGLTSQTVALTLTAGLASQIAAVNPDGGAYGTGLPIGIVTPNPTAKVTDAYGNAVANASVLWQLQSTTNGATVSSSSTSTASGGTTSVTWRLGDGDNGLKAFLGSTAAGSAFAQFTAATATGGVALSCNAGSRTRKTDLAAYNAGLGGYRGTFSMQPELAARFRSLRLFMSVTGQSSGTGDYPAVVRVYRGTKSAANLIATGTPTNNVIQLDGNNGNAAPVDFILTPNPNASVASAGNANFVLIELDVTAPSTRTLQIWYNQPAGGGTCGSTFLYAPGVTDFQNAPSRDKTPGVLIRVTN